MPKCQLGMQKNVQGHRIASVCKQTYDASSTISPIRLSRVSKGRLDRSPGIGRSAIYLLKSMANFECHMTVQRLPRSCMAVGLALRTRVAVSWLVGLRRTMVMVTMLVTQDVFIRISPVYFTGLHVVNLFPQGFPHFMCLCNGHPPQWPFKLGLALWRDGWQVWQCLSRVGKMC